MPGFPVLSGLSKKQQQNFCFEKQHRLAGTQWYCVIPGRSVFFIDRFFYTEQKWQLILHFYTTQKRWNLTLDFFNFDGELGSLVERWIEAVGLDGCCELFVACSFLFSVSFEDNFRFINSIKYLTHGWAINKYNQTAAN